MNSPLNKESDFDINPTNFIIRTKKQNIIKRASITMNTTGAATPDDMLLNEPIEPIGAMAPKYY